MTDMNNHVQLPLIRSPSYESFYQHMIDVWRRKPKDIVRMIEIDLPWLLDPNYVRNEN